MFTLEGLLQERGPLPGPEPGILSNPRKWTVWGDTRADNAKDCIGKGRSSRERQGKRAQNCSATWLEVSGFMGMGLVSGLSLTKHLASARTWSAQGPPWWPMNLSAKTHLSAKDPGSWVISSLLSDLHRSSTFMFRAASYSLSRPPMVRPLMQVAIIVPGQGGQFQSVVP